MSLIESEQLPDSWPAPEFNLLGADGHEYNLNDFRDKQGVLIIFTCNHCPYAQAAWPLMIDLYHTYGEDIHFVAINPNDAEVYPDDSMEQMKLRVEEWQIPFPYLQDKTQKVAKAYQAQCTPDIYLFKNIDSKSELYYHGRINDNWQEAEKVTEENLANALESLQQGKIAPEHQPASMGCSIKWKE